MSQACNRFVMDMTDTRMGPEQLCRNCKLMKKEHTQNNSQQLPSGQQSSNSFSDLKKKFSGGNTQVQEKFQGAVKQSIQFKKQEEQNQPQIKNSNQTQNQSDQSNVPIRKIESQTITNNYPNQPILNENQPNLEKQQSDQSNLTCSNQLNQTEQQPKQQTQIEKTSIQNNFSNNPFLKQDKEKIQKNEFVQGKPYVPQQKPPQEFKQQSLNEKKSEQQSEKNKNVVFGYQNKKSNDEDIQNNINKQSPLVQQNSIESQQSPPIQQQKTENQSNQQKIENPIKERAKNLPIFGFGPPPAKKTSNLQESESYLEQQMIERPTVQQRKNKRTIQEFSDIN
ncbi:unnamed protein product [Paramecium sonneborni]|uniref:Uncharacterized protein n=1 Tax=Paramecium sonneborni TaxID=65129 RepID=A0A8S1KBC1_9CILI|nr:unnamed protein product [Paramecium sonneborni]